MLLIFSARLTRAKQTQTVTGQRLLKLNPLISAGTASIKSFLSIIGTKEHGTITWGTHLAAISALFRFQMEKESASICSNSFLKGFL